MRDDIMQYICSNPKAIEHELLPNIAGAKGPMEHQDYTLFNTAHSVSMLLYHLIVFSVVRCWKVAAQHPVYRRGGRATPSALLPGEDARQGQGVRAEAM